MDCLVDSNPLPSIVWYHGTREVGEGKILNVDPVSRHDKGTYTCLATNDIGESMERSVDINVQCKLLQDPLLTST